MKKVILYRKYYDDTSLYPKYDNYNAINVDKVKDIPCDYYGVMGVPITFMDKYNPNQFEIMDANDYKEERIGDMTEIPIYRWWEIYSIIKTQTKNK